MGSLKAALALVPPSPTFSTLQANHLVALRARGEAAQQLRRKALRGAIVVFFTAGYRHARGLLARPGLARRAGLSWRVHTTRLHRAPRLRIAA